MLNAVERVVPFEVLVEETAEIPKRIRPGRIVENALAIFVVEFAPELGHHDSVDPRVGMPRMRQGAVVVELGLRQSAAHRHLELLDDSHPHLISRHGSDEQCPRQAQTS
ncbi:MAG: hypothetical protein EXS05_07595 [Planctomycetaceae bacterium]|nr:hypothetical protein [Planctomycetaceae bacterium]